MTTSKKRIIRLCVWIFLLAVASAVSAGEEQKITGTVVAAPEDPAGKLAPVVLETKDGVYQIAQNAIAAKMKKKWVGKKVDLTGLVEEIEGKKIITPWLIIESGVKVKAQPTG